MRRIAFVCALWASLLIATAHAGTAMARSTASTAREHGVTQKQKRADRHTKRARRNYSRRILATAATAATDPILFGDQTVETSVDSNPAGWPEAFPFSDTASGTVSSIYVYVDSHSRATSLIAGLYSDSQGHPGSLVASGSLTSPKPGSWNRVVVNAATVQSGSSYWVAVLGRGGTLYFRDRSYGPC